MRNLVKKSLLPVKNSLPFPVFEKTKVCKANFSNFLLKYLKNLKNLKKIHFRCLFLEKLRFLRQIFQTFCHYNAQNMRNLDFWQVKKSLNLLCKVRGFLSFLSFSLTPKSISTYNFTNFFDFGSILRPSLRLWVHFLAK